MNEQTSQKKQLFHLRLQTAILLLMLVILGAFLLFLAVRVNTVMDLVRQIDVLQLNEAVVSMKSAADSIAQVDVEQLNQGIRSLAAAGENLSDLDFQQLRTLLDSMEEFSSQMDAISGFLKGFLRK